MCQANTWTTTNTRRDARNSHSVHNDKCALARSIRSLAYRAGFAWSHAVVQKRKTSPLIRFDESDMPKRDDWSAKSMSNAAATRIVILGGGFAGLYADSKRLSQRSRTRSLCLLR